MPSITQISQKTAVKRFSLFRVLFETFFGYFMCFVFSCFISQVLVVAVTARIVELYSHQRVRRRQRWVWFTRNLHRPSWGLLLHLPIRIHRRRIQLHM